MRRLLTVCLLGDACAPEISRDAPPNRVIALFDPAAASPVVPLPNDLAFDAATGLLS